MSSSDGKSTCDISKPACGKGVSASTSNKKECTSCEQKVDEHIKAGASDNSNDTTGNCNPDIDTVVESISIVDISNDDNNAGSYISYQKLFQDPPPKEDCPICLLPMPFSNGLCGVNKAYQPCCGKMICYGCVVASEDEIEKGNIKPWCPLCRLIIQKDDDEFVKRIKKRMKLNDAHAFYTLGCSYLNGDLGLPQNHRKAFELWNQAAKLGSCNAHNALADAYLGLGDGNFDMARDIEKTIHHYKLAAMGGHEVARHILGLHEGNKGRIIKSIKHFMISARCGNGDSLKKIGEWYKDRYANELGFVTKDMYASTLRAYQNVQDEMKSDERVKAATQR